MLVRSSKLCIKLLDEESSKSILDLDALSGLAEVRFTKLQGSGMKDLIKVGISLGPVMSKIDVPARMVSLVPRFMISNESDEQVFVRQCFSKVCSRSICRFSICTYFPVLKWGIPFNNSTHFIVL